MGWDGDDIHGQYEPDPVHIIPGELHELGEVFFPTMAYYQRLITAPPVLFHMGLFDVDGVEESGSSYSAKKFSRRYDREELIDELKRFLEEYGSIAYSRFNEDPDYPGGGTISNRFGSWNSALVESGIRDPDEVGLHRCPDCGELYENIPSHWGSSSCSPPELTGAQEELITGSMMGDGSFSGGSVRIGTTSPNYVWSVKRSLSNIISGGIKVDRREEKYEEGEFYYINTISHPDLERYDWYGDRKRYPDWIKLTPTVLKHWYAQDGGLKWGDGSRRAGVHLYCKNEIDRPDFLVSKFEEIGFSPSVYSDRLYFSSKQSKSMLGYMGEPPRGYEYKWCWNDREDYDTLK